MPALPPSRDLSGTASLCGPPGMFLIKPCHVFQGLDFSFSAGGCFTTADRYFHRTKTEDCVFPVAKQLCGRITLLLDVVSELAFMNAHRFKNPQRISTGDQDDMLLGFLESEYLAVRKS